MRTRACRWSCRRCSHPALLNCVTLKLHTRTTEAFRSQLTGPLLSRQVTKLLELARTATELSIPIICRITPSPERSGDLEAFKAIAEAGRA